jgi:hypothetical protein
MIDAQRREVLAALGLKKAPELVAVRGQVAPGVAATLERLARESGLKPDEVVGLAVTDWTQRAERRLRAAPSQPAIPETDGR